MKIGSYSAFSAVSLCLLAAAALSGCHPLDRSIYSNKELLEMGRTVEFTEPGYRYRGCRKTDPDWAELKLYDQPERERVVLGKQGSLIYTGRKVCYRIGTNVRMTVNKDRRTDLGEARITKITWVKLDRLSNYHLSGRYYGSPNVVNAIKDSLRKRMSPRDDGIVTIVDFSYLRGSAVDEKSIIEEEEKRRGRMGSGPEVN